MTTCGCGSLMDLRDADVGVFAIGLLRSAAEVRGRRARHLESRLVRHDLDAADLLSIDFSTTAEVGKQPAWIGLAGPADVNLEPHGVLASGLRLRASSLGIRASGHRRGFLR